MTANEASFILPILQQYRIAQAELADAVARGEAGREHVELLRASVETIDVAIAQLSGDETLRVAFARDDEADATPLGSLYKTAVDFEQAVDAAYIECDDGLDELLSSALDHASRAVTALQLAWRGSDEPRTYVCTPGDGNSVELTARSVDELRPMLDAETSEWTEPEESTAWLDWRITCDDGTSATHTTTIEPIEPACDAAEQHAWRELPLRFSPMGPGHIVECVCDHCGTRRTTDTYAQRKDTGEAGLVATTYEHNAGGDV